jgi:alpha-beta hydrolase superfamily lysophospholipase
VPTLIVHTKDDQLASHEASQRAADRIAGARFVSLESGGHLMLGQAQIIRDELADFFLAARPPCGPGCILSAGGSKDHMRLMLLMIPTSFQ